ncbi:MAG: hypothetical protein IKH22_00675 [Prevotella sp.]|nr:hypothetical protein [Prevotella sp.]
MKKLLLSALALLAGLTASAQSTTTTIWEGEEPCVFSEDWSANIPINKSEFADVKAGDKIIITCSPEPEPVAWQYGSQLLLKTARAGWGSLYTLVVSNGEGDYTITIDANEIEVSEDIYDDGEKTGEQTVSTTMLDELKNYGLVIQGVDATVSKVQLEIAESGEEIDPNAIWHGNAAIGWNDNIRISPSKFANAKVGDQIIVKLAEFTSGHQMMLYNDWGKMLPGSVKGQFVDGDEEYVVNITTAGLAALKQYGIFIGGSGVTITDVLLVEGTEGPADALLFGELEFNKDGRANWKEIYTTTEIGQSNYIEFVFRGVPQWKQVVSSGWENLNLSPALEEPTAEGINYLYKAEDIQANLNDFIYQAGGEVTLLAINAIYREPIVCIDLDPAIATDGWGDREYNTQTFDGTIVGEGAASGWWLGGKDYSDFDKVYVELSAINIPQHEVEGEMQPGFAQLFVQCATGGDDTSNLTCGFGTHLYAVVDLDEYKNKTNQIVIQGSAGVTFTIVKACVCTNEYYEENILPNLPADPSPSMATAIETIGSEQADGAWYTLQGVRVAVPVKGVYIHNGKKMVLK